MIQKITDLTPYYKIDKYVIPTTQDAYRIGTNGVCESKWCRSGFKAWIGGEKDWHPLKPDLGTNGYPVVDLHVNGERVRMQISRLVLEAVCGPCPPGMEACHTYDPNPLNNWSWNLRWDTRSNNKLDCRVHGTDKGGEKCPLAVLDWIKVEALRADWATGCYTQERLGKKYGVDRATVGYIVRNKTWVI